MLNKEQVRKQYEKSKYKMFDEWCEENNVDEKTKNSVVDEANKYKLENLLKWFFVITYLPHFF